LTVSAAASCGPPSADAASSGCSFAACDFSHDGAALPLGVAIGIGIIAADDNPETVMARADQAMYVKKAAAAA